MFISLFLTLAIGSAIDGESPTTSSFTFHDSAMHEGRSTLAFRPLELGATPVRPLTFANPTGAGTRYGLVLVGTSRDSALAVAWDPKATGGPRLWLDANNDGQLDANESHALNGNEIELPFDLVVSAEKETVRLCRTLIVRYSALTGGLTYAVRGYVTGSLNLGGKTYRAMLTDGDADGCFHGAVADRLWIDLDGDGGFDPITEQFPLGSALKVQGHVFVVKSDATASRVEVFRRTTARGSALLALFGKRARPHADLEAHFVSDIGEMIAVQDFSRPVALPAGKYRVASLRFRMTDASGRDWTYCFAAEGGHQFTIDPEKETALTLLSGLSLKMTVSPLGPVAPEQRLSITPNVENPLGLFLVSCSVQEFVRNQPCSADIRFVSPEGAVVDRAASGFN